MQGRGVTNFSADKPSHGFTTSTTEFDDELIKRGIVTTEQAMMAKGASMEDASRLAEEKRRGFDSIIQGTVNVNSSTHNESNSGNKNNDDYSDDVSDDDDSVEDDFDDDEGDIPFMQRYRAQRLEQLKLEQVTKRQSELMSRSQPSSILHIGRDDWREEVNEASMDRWVIITMTEPSGDRRDLVVQELYRFGREFCRIEHGRYNIGNGSDNDKDSDDEKSQPRLLTINASDAIPNWPADRVPAMFAYRDGVKQQEWIAERRGEFPSRDILEQLFRKWSVI